MIPLQKHQRQRGPWRRAYCIPIAILLTVGLVWLLFVWHAFHIHLPNQSSVSSNAKIETVATSFSSSDNTDKPYLYVIVEYPYPWKILDLLQEEKGDKESWLGGRRKEEFEEALVRNLHHPAVREMHVMWEDEEGWRALQRIQAVHDVHGRLRVPTVSEKPQGKGRMQYGDAFVYAHDHLPHDAVVLVMNADLYLSNHGEWEGRMRPGRDGDQKLRSSGAGGGTKPLLYALSRFGNEGCKFDRDTCRLRRNTGSHDGFMFVNPVPQQISDRLAHPQNIPGAENVVVYEFSKAGYTPRNPCGVLPLMHNHCTAYRRYAARRMNTKGRSRSARPMFDF